MSDSVFPPNRVSGGREKYEAFYLQKLYFELLVLSLGM